MKVLEDGSIQCRARITGTYQGMPFVYEDPEGDEGSQYYDAEGDPSTYWWAEGNFSCDCNRSQFVGVDLDCGDEIFIDTIAPIDYPGVILLLMESTKGKA